MIDYAMFYQRAIDPNNLEKEVKEYDLFISAYNESERVQRVFRDVTATRKVWLVHPEYQFDDHELPTIGTIAAPSGRDEIVQVEAVLNAASLDSSDDICIDITGFMRHVLCFLVAKLASIGVSRFTAIYSEPIYYSKSENTSFSTKTSGVVRPIRGMAGSNYNSEEDYLVLGVGYDHALINQVAGQKDNAEIYPLFSFPSLSADMYQQSAMRAAQSGVISLSENWISNKRFAPANNPFATASVLQEIESHISRKSPKSNIYLSPLATKVQALGFAIYWQLQGRFRGAVSVLLPECLTYSRETSTGLNRVWLYELELLTP